MVETVGYDPGPWPTGGCCVTSTLSRSHQTSSAPDPLSILHPVKYARLSLILTINHYILSHTNVFQAQISSLTLLSLQVLMFYDFNSVI